MQLTELLRAVTRILATAHLPESEPEILTAALLGRSRGEFQLDLLLGREIPDARAQAVLAAAGRRARREPLQHITGEAPFFGLTLAVGPGVFVPRPETEVLVDVAVRELRGAAPGTIVDLGSGSGAIALALARALPRMRLVATEASAAAWPWLRRNIAALAPQVEARFGDWYSQLKRIPEPLAAIVSNPPYVPAGQVPRDPEVFLHDPDPALYSGADGLDEIRAIAAAAPRRLRPGGFVIVEHTELQGEAVRALFRAGGLLGAETVTDLTGRPRHTIARQPVAGECD